MPAADRLGRSPARAGALAAAAAGGTCRAVLRFPAVRLRTGTGRVPRDYDVLFGGREESDHGGRTAARAALSAASADRQHRHANYISHWLLAFALALFLSLALCKRVSELIAWRAIDYAEAPGRKYRAEDVPVLEMMAVASGFWRV